LSIKKSIGWCDITINPIKGRCKGGCWYCWTKSLYKRKFLDSEIRINIRVFDNLPLKSKKIFLCSTHDLFGNWISKSWRDIIFFYIESYPQHTFQILTKFPENIDRPMPDNVWLGTTITGVSDEEDAKRISSFLKQKAKVKFVSFEPLLDRIDYRMLVYDIQWVIIGKLTGYGKKYDPEIEWINEILVITDYCKIPIFLKDNLKEIWGGPLIQEFPKEER